MVERDPKELLSFTQKDLWSSPLLHRGFLVSYRPLASIFEPQTAFVSTFIDLAASKPYIIAAAARLPSFTEI